MLETAYAAAQANSKFSGLRAPATNITDSLTATHFLSGRGFQHRPQVSYHLQ